MPCAVQPVHQGPDPQGDVAAVAEVPPGVPANDGQPLQAGLDCSLYTVPGRAGSRPHDIQTDNNKL